MKIKLVYKPFPPIYGGNNCSGFLNGKSNLLYVL